MSVSSMAPRRKVTTYGKASRKPTIATADAFAEFTHTHADGREIDSNPSNRKWITASVYEDTAKAAVHFSVPGAVSESQISGTRNPYNQQESARVDFTGTSRVSTLAKRRALTSDALLDTPPNKVKYQQKTCASPEIPSKRQKISPVNCTEDCSVAYDDAGLQRHVAAQSEDELKRQPSFSGNPSVVCAHLEELSYISTDDEVDHVQKRTALRYNTSEPTINLRDKPSSKVAALWPAQGRTSKCEQLFDRVRSPARDISNKTFTKLYAKGNNSKAPMMLTGDEGMFPAQESPDRPETPPRSFIPIRGRKTPHEKELWNKLLNGSVPNSNQGISSKGLSLTNKKHVSPIGHPDRPKPISNCSQINASRSGCKRVVDTLHTGNHDSNHRVHYNSEGYESSSTGDFPESVKTISSTVHDAITLETSPSARSQNRIAICEERYFPNAYQSTPSFHAAGLKVTYARQRSYLTEDEISEVVMSNISAASESIKAQEIGSETRAPTYSSLPTEVNQPCEDYNSQGTAMRSLHELREAGGNVRLVGELEAILDDVEECRPSSGNPRRTRLLDLAAQLQNPSTSRVFIDQGLEKRLLPQLGVTTDVITNSLLAVAIFQLLASHATTPFLPQLGDPRIMDFLVDLLGSDQSLESQAKQRSHKLSKYNRQEYRKLCYLICTSEFWPAYNPPELSCHLLALQCLECIVQQTRKTDIMSGVLPAHAIRRIIATSIPCLSTSLLPSTPMSPVNLELAISIVESYTRSSAAEGHELIWGGSILEHVTGLLRLLESWSTSKTGNLQKLTLRLLVNITNSKPQLCEELSTPEVIVVVCHKIVTYFDQLSSQVISPQRSILLDNLILSLGALVNLAESSDRVPQLVMNLHTENGRSYLLLFLELFTTKSKCASEVRVNVASTRLFTLTQAGLF